MRIPKRPKPMSDLLTELGPRLGDIVSAGLSRLSEDRYLHWDVLRYKPVPGEFTAEEWWMAIKLARASSLKLLPFTDQEGRPFQFSMPPPVLRMLHLVDRDASGRIEVPESITNSQTRDRFLVRSLIEEAITSSQLEGAATTRKDAKEMLRAGRKPRTRDEQMIFNNYRAMEFIRENYTSPLTPRLILDLQTILTTDTLDDPSGAGRWRRDDENIRVVDARDETVLHVPPPANQLHDRVDRLCAFANPGEDEPFIHPVIRSILIHFMIGFDHPFVDGNGRTARALFYWSMARHGYWLMEFVSISAILRKAPSKYARSYLYTETDENDATYFVIYQLDVIVRAIKSMHEYLASKAAEVREADTWLRNSSALRALLNHRQVALVQHALKHPYEAYTVRSHMISHHVTYETARTDLLQLAEQSLLEKTMRGRAYLFVVPPDLQDRLSAVAKA